MYTLIWIDNGEDRWDRFEDKESLKEFLKYLKKTPGVCEGDIYIFPPEADAYAMDYTAFMMNEI